MASKVKIQFEIEGLPNAVENTQQLEESLKGLDAQAKKTEKTLDKTADAAKSVGTAGEEAGKNAEAGTKIVDEAFGGLGTKVKEVGGGIKQLGTSAISTFKSAVMGASAMGKALIATGIGAIVVALGLVAAYWDDITAAISGVSSDQQDLLASTQATAQANQESLDAISASENSLRLAGKSEAEIRDLKIQQTNETIKSLEAQLLLQKEQSDAQVAALERNKTIAQNVIRFLTAPLTLLLKGVDTLSAGLVKVGVLEKATNLEESFSGGIAGLIFDPEGAKVEGDKAVSEIEKNLAKLKNQRDGYILQGKADQGKANQERIDNEKELNAELLKLQAENIADEEARALAVLEVARKAEKQSLIDKKASRELLMEFDKQTQMQRQAIIDEAQAKRDAKDAEEQAKYLANRQVIDDILQQANLDAIEDQFARSQAELQIQMDTDLEKLRLAGATEAEIAKVKGQYIEKKKKLDKEEATFKKKLRNEDVNQALQATSTILGSITELVGEGSVAGKAAAVSQATIDTYLSASSAYKSVVGIPIVGPVLAPIAAGVAAAAGIMSVKKILSTKIPGKGGGGGGAPTVPTAAAFNPNAAIAQNTAGQQTPGENLQLGAQQGSTGATVIKAYVVSSDMSTEQEKDKKINDLAKL